MIRILLTQGGRAEQSRAEWNENEIEVIYVVPWKMRVGVVREYAVMSMLAVKVIWRVVALNSIGDIRDSSWRLTFTLLNSQPFGMPLSLPHLKSIVRG